MDLVRTQSHITKKCYSISAQINYEPKICAPPEILIGPASILVPVNSFAVFECRAYCGQWCSFYWTIDGSSASHQNQKNRFMERGFSFLNSPPENNIYSIRLSVNASVLVNNTQLSCVATIRTPDITHVNRSSDATLLVTSGDNATK